MHTIIPPITGIHRTPPPYMQIADYYRELISTGALRDGDRLPTVADLAETWKCSPGTAHKALRQLRAERLINTRRQGSTVRGWAA